MQTLKLIFSVVHWEDWTGLAQIQGFHIPRFFYLSVPQPFSPSVIVPALSSPPTLSSRAHLSPLLPGLSARLFPPLAPHSFTLQARASVLKNRDSIPEHTWTASSPSSMLKIKSRRRGGQNLGSWWGKAPCLTSQNLGSSLASPSPSLLLSNLSATLHNFTVLKISWMCALVYMSTFTTTLTFCPFSWHSFLRVETIIISMAYKTVHSLTLVYPRTSSLTLVSLVL